MTDIMRPDSYYELWPILWVMSDAYTWMQSDAHECNPNVVCLILTDLQTREIHIKNMTPPNFIKNKNGIYRRQVSIGWPRSYEPHAHPAAPCRWRVATFYVMQLAFNFYYNHCIGSRHTDQPIQNPTQHQFKSILFTSYNILCERNSTILFITGSFF